MAEESAERTAASEPPVPAPGSLAQFFWDAVAEGRMDILRCDGCGQYVHYPRPICDRCLGEELSPSTVSGRGTLYAWTSVRQAFHPYYVDKIPYVLAVVELAEQEGLRVTTTLIDVDEKDVRCGMPVEVTFTEVVPGRVLPLFRPAVAPPAPGVSA